MSVNQWGRLQVVFNHQDVTYFRNIPVQVRSWASGDPFGDSVAEIHFPQITPFDEFGLTHSVPWATNGGEHVEIRRIHPDGVTKTRLWAGTHVAKADEIGQTTTGRTFHCVGALFQADFAVKMPGFLTGAQDCGTVIADAMNGVLSRDYGHTVPVTTGITTRQRGGGTSLLTGFIQDVLATMTVSDGSNQWTLTQDATLWCPVIQLKDRTTVNATITAGTQGIDLRLERDYTQAANVIYTEGIATDGSFHRGTVYPNLRADAAPAFPGTNYVAGSATTGFDPFADEMRRGGYTMASGDTYATADSDEVKQAQRRAGITEDGIVGPQTWTAIFQAGSNGYDLTGAYYQPAYASSVVEPYLYNANGSKIGANPAYDPTRLRVERFENVGEGISRKQAKASAKAEVLRTYPAGLAGQITLAVDPEEISRFNLRAGMNIRLKQYRGLTVLLHIAGVTVDWPGQTVTLDVDEHARDLLTLAGLRSRNKDAATDPARRVSTGKRRSRNVADEVVVFDSEAGAGRIPRHGIYGGLWTVLRIPAGEVGRIAKIEYTSDTPLAKYAVGIFGAPVTSNFLAAHVGNPLATNSKWRDDAQALLDAGLVECWGTSDQACGYWPKAQSDSGATISGVFKDAGGFDYSTTDPPWLWVAEYSPTTTYLKGRLYVAPSFT